MKNFVFFAIFVGALFGALTAPAPTFAITLPDHVKQICGGTLPTSSDYAIGTKTAKQYSSLPGIRSGRWSGEMEVTIIIQDVTAEGKVNGIYVSKGGGQYNLPPQCKLFDEGKVKGDEVIMPGKQATVECTTANMPWKCTWYNSRFQHKGEFE